MIHHGKMVCIDVKNRKMRVIGFFIYSEENVHKIFGAVMIGLSNSLQKVPLKLTFCMDH